MSKKEQKLKKNLYKALTEYFIHNPKNSLTSSESFLDQLAAFRMETTLPIAIKHDVKYQKAQKKCNKANEKIRDLNLFSSPFFLCMTSKIISFFFLVDFFPALAYNERS